MAGMWRWFVESLWPKRLAEPLRLHKTTFAGQDALIANRELTPDEVTLLRRVWEAAYTSAKSASPIIVKEDNEPVNDEDTEIGAPTCERGCACPDCYREDVE